MNKIYCERRQGDYVMLYREPFRDPELSLKARGFLATVFSLPKDWDFSVKGICAIVKEGKDCVWGIIRELKERGYCRTEEVREGGKIVGEDYYFYEESLLSGHSAPYTEKPCAENPTQYNKTINKKEVKKENPVKPFASESLNIAWNQLLQEKKWKSKSAHALELSINKIKSLGIDDALCAIETTIERGYQGIFPPKPYEVDEWRRGRTSKREGKSVDQIIAEKYGK